MCSGTYHIWRSVSVRELVYLLFLRTRGLSMRGEQGKERAGSNDGAGTLTEHIREDAQGLVEGIAVTAERVPRFFCFFGCPDVYFFAFDNGR